MLRFDIIRAVFRKELTESLRDRRSLAVMFGIPLIIYPLVTLGISSLGMQRQQQMKEKVYNVAVVNRGGAPTLMAQLEGQKTGLKIVPQQDPQAALAAGKVDAVLEVPAEFEAAALRGENGETKLRIRLDRSRTESQVVENKIEDVVDEYEKWVLDERLKARNLPATLLSPVETETDDIATASQRLGKILGMALPNILLFTGMLGALFPAINAMTTEREVGTFEALLITPARKIELLLAKGALVLLASVFTALINLVSMSLVLLRVASLAGPDRGELAISFMPLVLTFVAAMPALIFFSALTMLVGLFARSFREANSYATPVMLIPLVSLGVSIMEPEPSRALLITPVVNTTVIIREVLAGRATAEAFGIAFLSSCVYAALMLMWAARLFTSESLVNPSWEPLSWRGLKTAGRLPAGVRKRLPAVDESIALFVVVLLLLFYVSPSLMNWSFVPKSLQLMPVLIGNQLLLILLPTALFAWLGRYDVRRTFSLNPTRAPAYLGGVLMGVGLALAVGLVQYVQQKFWKASPENARMMADLFVPALLEHPVLTIGLVGLLAGTCEELMFRGPIHAAMARKLPMWPTLIIGSFLFAALHMDLHGLPIRMMISLFLAWLVWRGTSIFPAMLMHAFYDWTQLAQAWWQVRGKTRTEIEAIANEAVTGEFWVRVGIGVVLLVVGWVLCRMAFRKVSSSLPDGKVLVSAAGPT